MKEINFRCVLSLEVICVKIRSCCDSTISYQSELCCPGKCVIGTFIIDCSSLFLRLTSVSLPLTGTEKGHAMIVNMGGETRQPRPPAHTGTHIQGTHTREHKYTRWCGKEAVVHGGQVQGSGVIGRASGLL